MSGEVPPGWTTSRLDQVATEQRSRWEPSTQPDDEVEHFSIPAFDDSRRARIERASSLKSSKFLVEDGDTLLSRLNPVTPRVWSVNRQRADLTAVASSEMCVLRPSSVDAGFLSFAMEGTGPSRAMIERASGTTGSRQRVSRADVLSIELAVPPLPEQRAIAEILGSLDDRIEWCLATAKGCLETMQAVASGGTRKLKVSDLAEFVNGGAFTKGATGAGRLIIKISELNSGVSAASKFSDVEAPPSRIADTGDVLFSWSATLDVFRWTGEQALINQHIFKVIPSKGLPMWLVFAKLAEAMPEFQKIAADRATTMGHIKKTHLDQVTVDIADVEELSARDELGSSLWDQHLTLSLQAAAAQRTRNLLLPELVSGRLRVNDVDGFLERAGLA